MKISEVIYNRLQSDSAINAIVGNRIYPIYADQHTQLPYIVHDIISISPSDTLDAASKVDTYRIQIDVYAERNSAAGYNATSTVHDLIRSNMDRLPHGSYQGLWVDGVRYVGINAAAVVDDTDYIMLSMDYEVRVKR